jgi:hypothetical protein
MLFTCEEARRPTAFRLRYAFPNLLCTIGVKSLKSQRKPSFNTTHNTPIFLTLGFALFWFDGGEQKVLTRTC